MSLNPDRCSMGMKTCSWRRPTSRGCAVRRACWQSTAASLGQRFEFIGETPSSSMFTTMANTASPSIGTRNRLIWLYQSKNQSRTEPFMAFFSWVVKPVDQWFPVGHPPRFPMRKTRQIKQPAYNCRIKPGLSLSCDCQWVNLFTGIRGRFSLTLISRHGVREPRNPWSDGPENITQCPIPPGTSLLQEIDFTTEEGTLWWHAHSDWSRATVHGAIIIFPAIGTSYPYPRPHAEETIVLGIPPFTLFSLS